MADENANDSGSGNDGNAPPADDGGADDSVTLTQAQLKSIENSIWAKARRQWAREGAPPDPFHEQRVQRGLKLLSEYERVSDETQVEQVRMQARLDNMPTLGDRMARVLRGKSPGEPAQPTQPAAAAPAQQSELGQLLELMKLDIQSRMADKLPKAPVQYASPADALHGEINAQVSAIPEDDPDRLSKVQALVNKQLRGVKVAAGTHNPHSVLVSKKKG